MSFVSDFLNAVFKTTLFYQERFLKISRARIQLLGFAGIFFGLIVGNLITYLLVNTAKAQFILDKEPYLEALKALNIGVDQFHELLSVQKAYSLLLVVLSPFIGYMGAHLFGGALFFLIWLLMPQDRSKLDFNKAFDVASIALCSMIFYIIPGVGPLLAVIMVAVSASRGLALSYNITGFAKVTCVLIACYICFFISGASLQLLANPLTTYIH